MEFPCNECLPFHVNSPQEIIGEPFLHLCKANEVMIVVTDIFFQ